MCAYADGIVLKRSLFEGEIWWGILEMLYLDAENSHLVEQIVFQICRWRNQ